MSDARTPVGERIERAHYGPQQHQTVGPGTVGAGGPTRYGEPQHDPEQSDPDAPERFGYEDRHWREVERLRDDGCGEEDGRRQDDDGVRPTAESASGAAELLA